MIAPRRITALLAALALGAPAVLAGCGGRSPSSGAASVGRPAPAWSGTTINGTNVDSASLRGKWVVLNFFASWCQPCRAETPQLVAFGSGPAKVRRAAIVGVLYLDDANKARAFAASHSMTWPILNDHNGRLAIRYNIRGLPESFVINPQGDLVKEIFGGVTVAKLEQTIPADQ